MAASKPPPATAGTALATVPAQSLVAKFADRFGVDQDKLLTTLKGTVFRGDPSKGERGELTNSQMVALLVVADQYHLNPFTREIYAFPDPKSGGIVPVVSIDGWMRIVNEHPQFDGLEVRYSDTTDQRNVPEFVVVTIHRKDRSRPITILEYFSEVSRSTDPWRQMPRRMLRHKGIIQCSRIAFGFAGIYDPEEAVTIVDAQIVDQQQQRQLPRNGTAGLRSRLGVGPNVTDVPVPPKPPASAPAPAAAPAVSDLPAKSYAEVREALQSATTTDAFMIALADVEAVVDEQHRGELSALADKLYGERFPQPQQQRDGTNG